MMSWKQQCARRYVFGTIAGLVIVLCAVSTAYSLRLTFRSYHTAFLWDQWGTIEFLDRVLQGTATFRDFIAQHNEHRILIPRLIFLLDLLLTNANNSINFGAILVSQVVHLGFFFRMVATRVGNSMFRWALTSCVALLLFSIVQWENFIWGFQVQFVGIHLFVTVAAYALSAAQLGSKDGAWKAVAIGLIFGTSASLMMSNGAAALICIALVFAAARLFNWITALVASVGMVLLIVYALTFTPNPGHTPIGFAFVHPLEYVSYCVAYLGGAFAPLDPEVGQIAGVIGVAASILVGLGLITGRLRRDQVNLTLVAIIWFVVLTAAMTGLGRASFGLEQAIASRYATPSAIFWAAVLTVTTLWILDQHIEQVYRIAAALAVLVSVTALSLASTAYAQLEYRNTRLLRSIDMTRATDAILSEVYDDSTLRILFHDPEWMKRSLIPILKERRLNIFAKPQTWPLGAEVPTISLLTDQQRCLGNVDVTEAVDFPNAFLLRGWAWDLAERRPFERLVTLSADRRVIGYGSAGVPRWDVTAVMPNISGNRLGWIAYANRPAGPIKVYGLLSDGELCLIGSAIPP